MDVSEELIDLISEELAKTHQGRSQEEWNKQLRYCFFIKKGDERILELTKKFNQEELKDILKTIEDLRDAVNFKVLLKTIAQ